MKQKNSIPATVQAPVFYNVFLETVKKDKLLIAQTSDPCKFVDMHYPAFELIQEDPLEAGGEISWRGDSSDTLSESVMAVPVRDIAVNILLSEADYDKFRRII
jgi:hypothetical protein